jgi:hypothetical protein
MENLDINHLDTATVAKTPESNGEIDGAQLSATTESALPTGFKFWAAFVTVSFGMFFSGYVRYLSLSNILRQFTNT